MSQVKSDRRPVVSINLSTVQAKARDRDRLQADVDAFLRKRGNRIQRLDQADLGQPLNRSYRELSDQRAERMLGDKSRRRRRQDEEE